MIDRRAHWDRAYAEKGATGVSWYQRQPDASLAIIAGLKIEKSSPVIDVGGGASTLVDALLDEGYRDVTVLDVSPRAISESKARLGARASDVMWVEADITTFEPSRRFGLWHDRAAFHFLTDAADRARYVANLHRALAPDGVAIIATFAIDGPSRCSGLDVVRYDAAAITRETGDQFAIDDVRQETHRTPWNADQRFTYFTLRHRFSRSGK